MTNVSSEVSQTVSQSAGSRSVGVLVAVAVGCVLLLPWVIGPSAAESAAKENRSIRPLPGASAGSWKDVAFFSALEAALTDRLRSKPPAVAAVNAMVLATTGRSASPKVVAGANPEGGGPRLYYAGEFTEACPHARAPHWAAEGMNRLVDAARQSGRRVEFIVVPNKSTTQPPQAGVPQGALMACALRARRELIALSTKPESPVTVIEPAEVLAWDSVKPYWEGDTHWTPEGGLAVVEAAARAFGGEPAMVPGRVDTTSGELVVREDLYSLLGLERLATSPSARPENGTVRKEVLQGRTPYPILHYESLNPIVRQPARVLVIYDSFIYVPELQDLLGSVFSEAWLVQWDGIADIEGLPEVDAVLMESAERIAGARLAGFYDGGPSQPVLDRLRAAPQSAPNDN